MEKCTFCGNEKEKDVITGKDGAICYDCLGVCNDIQAKKTAIEGKADKSISVGLDLNIEPKKVKQKIDEIVIGQEDAKKQLIMECYKHYNSKSKTRNNLFLLGNSGVGKTFLVRNLASIIGVPFVEFDSTTFSETGYKGKDTIEIVQELYTKCGGDKEKTESAIVFIDEIDKIVTTSNGEGVNKVQHALLKLIEGATYPIQKGKGVRSGVDMIDTGEILFIVAGACVGIQDIVKKRTISTGNIGFSIRDNIKTEQSKELIAEDLVEFGFIPEFVGRFPIIVQLKDLTKEDFRSILTKSKESVIPEYVSLFKEENIELSFTTEIIEKLTEKAKSSPMGVRAVQHSLAKGLNTLLFNSLLDEQKSITINEISMLEG